MNANRQPNGATTAFLATLPREPSGIRVSLLLCAFALWGGQAAAQVAPFTVVFAEDFESVELIDSPNFELPNAWSPQPPPGWEVVRNVDTPGGTVEFEGWTFWREGFWQEIGGGLRPFFDRGRGVVAVADPDLWNDPLQPDVEPFAYRTLLQSPPINLTELNVATNRLTLGFDTSWMGGCCGEGGSQEVPGNVAGVVRLRTNPDANPIEVLRWESAPFFDSAGRPTRDPVDPQGNTNRRNPRFQPMIGSDRFFIDLSDLLDAPQFASEGEGFAAASSSVKELIIEFGVEGEGEDAFWAVDNVEVSAVAGDPILGDLFIDGFLDAKDIDEFAFGLLDQEAYEDAWGGVSPGDRGSPDGTFDYDDIPWFIDLISPHVGGAEAALAIALTGVPEPGAGTLAAVSLLAAAARRSRRPLR